MEIEVDCPYCGESVSLWIDAGGGGSQQYVEDCSVCCRPIDIRVVERHGDFTVEARKQDA